MSTPGCVEILITDIPSRIADAKISNETRKDYWRIVPYNVESIGDGRALCQNRWKSGEVEIQLHVQGWHRIHFISRYSDIRAKLSGDLCFNTCESIFQGEDCEGWYDVEEVFWRKADLTNKNLIIDDTQIDLLAIRLIPCEPVEEKPPVKWPMAFTHDDQSMMSPLKNLSDLFERCEKIPDDSCARMVLWMGGLGDTALHFTNVGTRFGQRSQEAWLEGHQHAIENMSKFTETGVDPADEIVRYCKKRNWELYWYVRHRGWGGGLPLISGPENSTFCESHPEFRNLTKQGEPIAGLSIAFPEVSEHLCNYYAELAATGADGVCVCFIRGCPIVLYEEPMVQGFLKQHGQDPRNLPDDEPAWLDFCGEVVTGFMEQLRKAIGPDRKLAAMINGTEQLNRQYGMDIKRWVSENIVDDLFIMCHQYGPEGVHRQAEPEFLQYEYFQNLPGRDSVRLWPMLYMWDMFDAEPEKHCNTIGQWLDQGADGYAFWDGASWATDKQANICDLGRTPRPAYIKPQRLIAKYPLVKWDGDVLYNRYSPIEGW